MSPTWAACITIPKKKGVTITDDTTQRRPFFSFLSSSILAEAEEETNIAKEKKQQEEEATRILLDGVRHRISIQNAHPLGPWQAILTVVQNHYNGWLKVQEEAEAMLTTADVIQSGTPTVKFG